MKVYRESTKWPCFFFIINGTLILSIHGLKKFKTIRAFGRSIYNNDITLDEADKKQSELTDYYYGFHNTNRIQSFENKEEKVLVLKNVLLAIIDGRAMILDTIRSTIFS